MANPVPRVAAASIPAPNNVPNASPTDSPNGGSLNGNGDTISGAGQDSSSMDILPHETPTSSSFDILPGASPTPSPTNPGILPPLSTSILTFNNTANFGTSITGRVFYTDDRAKTFAWTYNSSNTKVSDIFWFGKESNGESFNASEATVIAFAVLNGPESEVFSKFNAFDAILNLTAPDVIPWYEKEMVIQIGWSNDYKEEGYTQSGVFTVARRSDHTFSAEDFGRNATRSQQDSQGFEGLTPGTQITSAPSSITSRPSSSGGVGLSTGAIAGIAVGCSIAGIALLAFLVWFFLRRRRRSMGEGYKATRQTSNSFAATKEARPSVAESPIVSPFSDDGEARGFSNSNIAIALPQRETTRRPVPAPHDEESDRPESAASGNRPRGISHLVEEGMTEADILRLEEEERHLDAEIERAARRGSS
ncbi:hypothetical protein GGI43DRAFT_152744 [Trichoderma evansii]